MFRIARTTFQNDYYSFAYDYYPFGMLLPNRHEAGNEYRYGFNGMEKDDEVKGEGNSYTTTFRQLDPRIGRWLSLDPAMSKYPNQSPYITFNNNPVYWVDPEGDDPPKKYIYDTGKYKRRKKKFDKAYSKEKSKGNFKDEADLRSQVWKNIENKRWAWVRAGRANPTARNSSITSYNRIDQLAYTDNGTTGIGINYTPTTQKVSTRTSSTTTTISWVPDNGLTSPSPVGITLAPIVITAESPTVSTIPFSGAGNTTVNSVTVSVQKLSTAANPTIPESVTILDGANNPVATSAALGGGNTISATYTTNTNSFTLTTVKNGGNRNDGTSFINGTSNGAWPYYNVTVIVNSTTVVTIVTRYNTQLYHIGVSPKYSKHAFMKAVRNGQVK